jgi:hypothetical protein
MRVKVLRQFLNGRDLVHEGQEIDVTDVRGRQLVINRLVTMNVGGGMRAPAGVGAIDPTPSPPPGGLTGEGTPVSSPRRVRAPRMPNSRSGGDGRGF